jgi:L-alanine-DL-glutamate epimerase-like enolase superfamily enzyme
MWVNRPEIENGWMQVSRGPGFDITLDPEMVKRYRVN